MFYSEELLSKDGPLAYAWLAANLEKKLTKQQLLNASVTDSAKAIENSSNALEQSSSQRQVEPMALRLSGQLLYGIVRIYSRKAKYLYEDVNDILMKLKAAFATSKSVTLPLQSTVISSIKSVTLADTVTQADLLYRKPFDFDAIVASQQPEEPRMSGIVEDHEEETFPDSVADSSIELPRAHDEQDDLDMGGDVDLDLNFDLDGPAEQEEQSSEPPSDQSIEVGRAAEEANASALDTFEPLDLPDFEEPVLEMDNNNNDDDASDPVEPLTPPDTSADVTAAAKGRVYTNKDVVRTTTRRIVMDSVTEMSAHQLRQNQRKYLDEEVSAGQSQKRVRSLVAGFGALVKRRHIEEPEPSQPTPPREATREPTPLQDAQPSSPPPDFDAGFDDIDVAPQSPGPDLSFDLGEADVQAPQSPEQEAANEAESSEEPEDASEKSTRQVAGLLRHMLETDEAVTFSQVLEADRQSESALAADAKAEGSKMFFELLVLGGRDNVKLHQDRLFGEITIQDESL